MEEDCGDVRSRTSYNSATAFAAIASLIVVTSDLGRVTTFFHESAEQKPFIVVTSDLGRVTTEIPFSIT